MPGPVGALEEALFTTLNDASIAAAGASGVHNRIAPQGSPLPYVIVGWQGGGDENSSPRRARNTLYSVQALAETLDDAEAIDAALDALLHMHTLAVTGWDNFWMAREGDIAYQEVDPTGRPIFHAGGIYRIRLSH
jgi:hypothetical protein